MNSLTGLRRAIIATALTFTLVLVAGLLPVGAQQSEADAATPVADSAAIQDVGPRFLIQPVDGVDGDYFTLVAAPGSINELVVLLANIDDEPLKLHTYANDAIPIVNGGFAVAAESVPPAGTATWLDYPAETFEFEPAQGVERTFTVTIPADTKPGQYIAGLVLETAEPFEVQGTDLFTQIISKSIAVFIIVPGAEEPAFELGAPEFLTDGSVDRIEVPVSNTGNVLVKPAGDLTLRNLEGDIVLTAPVAMGSVYAGTTVQLSVPVTTAIADGDFELSIVLEDEATGTAASMTNGALAVSNQASAPAQFAINGAVSLSPNSASPVFADVSLTITNTGAPVEKAELLLDVVKDGEPVESFVLGSSLALPAGDTSFAQRYVPPAGWEPGSWTFVVRLNVIDPSTGSATNVATLDTLPPLDVEG